MNTLHDRETCTRMHANALAEVARYRARGGLWKLHAWEWVYIARLWRRKLEAL